jgi:hypothetical protein
LFLFKKLLDPLLNRIFRHEVVHLDIRVSRHHTWRMRTTITVDEDIYEAAQHLSRVSGERLGKVISKLARRGLERKAPPVRKGARRFPTFEIPAGSPIISASRIERVLDEDSLL